MDSIELTLMTMLLVTVCIIKKGLIIDGIIYASIQNFLQGMLNKAKDNLFFKVFFILLGAIYYLYDSFVINYLINILLLFFLLNMSLLNRLTSFLKKIKFKKLSKKKLNHMMLYLINENIKFYFPIIFYFALAGIPASILYFYIISNKNKRVIEYLLYIPTRVLWLLILIIYLIYSQGFDTASSINWKERNLSRNLNGTWIESIVSGMLGIQLVSMDGLIVVGEANREIIATDLIKVFYLFIFLPYTSLIILEVL